MKNTTNNENTNLLFGDVVEAVEAVTILATELTAENAGLRSENADLKAKLATYEAAAAVHEMARITKKVNRLMNQPNDYTLNTSQVAELFEVSAATIRKQVERHRSELEKCGMQYMTFNEIKEYTEVDTRSLLDSGFSYRGATMFPRRAILQLGMTLRKGKVAKTIRDQMLNF